MVIKPFYQPFKFCQVFGEYDTSTLHPDWVWIQRERAKAWDSAIEYVMLNRPVQQPVLTHNQPKGD